MSIAVEETNCSAPNAEGFAKSVSSTDTKEICLSLSAVAPKSYSESKPMRLAFSGKRRRGKTTAADYLVRHHKFVKLSFAEILKLQAKELFDFTDEQLNSDAKDKPFRKYDWTPRDFLIKYGQFMRYFDQDYWATKLVVKAASLEDSSIVVDDLRFKNEAKILKAMGFKLVRIERYKKDLDITYDPNVDGDVSETDLDDFADFDAVVEPFQNTTKPVLFKSLDGLVKTLGNYPLTT